ncbi:retrotransposable element Tf2 [Tanacetum coccineum]
MTGEQPKQWLKWLSLVEWLYNTNHHSSIDTTPFEVVYGQPPPVYVPYVGGESKVDAVDKTLTAREAAIELLKFHLRRAQDRMKSHADRNRTDRQYELDD